MAVLAPLKRRQEGYCRACHYWFRVWPSPDTTHDEECPVCRAPASILTTPGNGLPV